jgi:hypothetical protein
LSLLAQKDSSKLISVELSGAGVEELVLAIEKQTSLHFYYDARQFDSLRFDISEKNQPVTKVLERALEEKGFEYSIAAPGYAFITKGYYINTAFADNDTLAPASLKGSAPLERKEKNAGREKAEVTAGVENKIYEVGDKASPGIQHDVIVAGYVVDSKTGEPVVGVYLHVDAPNVSVVTDQFGYYSIALPKGRHVIEIQSLGMKDTRRQVQLYGDGKLNIDLQSQVLTIKNVTISAQKLSNVKGTQMGMQKIDIKTIKQVPVVFGEADILRVVTTLPGVKTVGEASTGLNVRGDPQTRT